MRTVYNSLVGNLNSKLLMLIDEMVSREVKQDVNWTGSEYGQMVGHSEHQVP
jgi:hypothetical protein